MHTTTPSLVSIQGLDAQYTIVKQPIHIIISMPKTMAVILK